MSNGKIRRAKSQKSNSRHNVVEKYKTHGKDLRWVYFTLTFEHIQVRDN